MLQAKAAYKEQQVNEEKDREQLIMGELPTVYYSARRIHERLPRQVPLVPWLPQPWPHQAPPPQFLPRRPAPLARRLPDRTMTCTLPRRVTRPCTAAMPPP